MRYTIGEKIGDAGGFGSVYKCLSEANNEYAIKLLKNTDPDSIDRFKKEIRLTMRLSHPNIINIVAYDVDQDRKWYIMPLYSSSLVNVLPGLYGQYDRQYTIISEILNGVIYLHSEGVLHRDLKPQNILYNSDSDIVINDFGLGRQVNSDSDRLTRLGDAFGTARYTAPEQFIDASTADRRSDIFSLGRIIEDIVTGALKNPIPESDLEYIINKCIQSRPEKRFDSVIELKSAIDSVYQRLLGIIEFSTIGELLSRMKLGAASSEDIHTLAVKLLTDPNGDQLEAFFQNISNHLYIQLEQDDNELVEKLVVQLQEYYTGQGWGFGYTDTIGNNCKRLYDLSSSATVRANLLYTIIDVGISHNRWYVMGIATQFLKDIAGHVAESFELASLLAQRGIFLNRLDVDYTDLPSCLQPYYNNTNSLR